MNKLILEANLLMVFGLIPDITLDSFYMRMRIGKRAVTALPGFSSIQTHYVLEPPLCGSTRGMTRAETLGCDRYAAFA